MLILEEEDFESPSDSIETTQDELDGFYVVKVNSAPKHRRVKNLNARCSFLLRHTT